MNRTVLKTLLVGAVAATALIAPAAQAGGHGYGHKQFHHKHFTYGHTYRHYRHYRVYRPHYYVAPTCKEYAWVWSYGHKKYACVAWW